MLNILVAEATTILANGQANIVASPRLAAAALAPERLDRVSTLYADGHSASWRGIGLRILRDLVLKKPAAGGEIVFGGQERRRKRSGKMRV
jgi:hypothetical protein